MINKIDLLNNDEFIELVKNSSNVSDILRSLNYSTKGNSWAYKIVQERMKKLNITFGKKYTNKSTTKQLTLSEILVEDSGYNRTKLKDRLVKEGLKEYKCEICGITEWNNLPISLELHHVNGVNNDNRLENLQLLCPNCYSQTNNFCTRGKGRIINTKCDNLPIEDKEKIMNTVRELGIVEARKKLPYRNSLINAVVKRNHDVIVMIFPDKSELKFTTVYDASKYMFEILGIGTNENSCRSGISKCCSKKQKHCHGYKFERRSAEA